MRLSGDDVIAMCFSSSIICLLIVTSHGAAVRPTNESRTLLHRRNNHLLTDPKNILNSSHHRSYQKDLISHNDYLTHHASESPARVSKTTSHLLRKQRSAEDAEQLNELSAQGSTGNNPSDASQSPVQQESSSSQILRQSNTSNLQNSSQPSKSADQQNASNCGQRHSNHDCETSGEDGCDHNYELKDRLENDHDHEHEHDKQGNISGTVWLYASIAVVIISLCGLLSVAIIPIMQKWFYHTLLQFLVGLAVGSLSGDGLLHLMPHAILGGEESHDHGSHNHNRKEDCMESLEQRAIWRGLAALGGIFIFFIAERLLGTLTAYRRQKKEAKLSRHSKNMLPVMQREDGTNNGNVGEKLAQPKKNSYDHIREKDEKETIQMLQTEATPTRKGSSQSTHEIGFHGRSSFSLEPEMSVAYRPDSESSVIVSDHHGHGHGHRHEIPHSVSAVALMVIMGDGLHNFCDGLAIGAAFASSSADGVSTTVAVFCHELPHELGDFAMLLKTGMKVKQALFYNGLSSILCFVGMVIGVCLGNVNSATNWVFAGTAGMFLYIALVDMLPELTSGNEPGLAALSTLAVQFMGISIGICIMLLIALYEHELLAIVS